MVVFFIRRCATYKLYISTVRNQFWEFWELLDHEYINEEVKWFVKEGIRAQCRTYYSQQRNRIAERKNRTLMDAGISKEYWANRSKYWEFSEQASSYEKNLIEHQTNYDVKQCSKLSNILLQKIYIYTKTRKKIVVR